MRTTDERQTTWDPRDAVASPSGAPPAGRVGGALSGPDPVLISGGPTGTPLDRQPGPPSRQHVDPVSGGAGAPWSRPPLAPAPDGRLDAAERDARRALRRQILRLELRLADALTHDLLAGARGRLEQAAVLSDDAGRGPRLLGLGSLERRRDELVARLAEVELRRADERANRALLAAMYRDPRAHRGVRLETADLAERGCRVYEVRPRFGLIGVLGGWWRVKVSSGCPLAPAPAGARPSRLSPAAAGPRTCAGGRRRS